MEQESAEFGDSALVDLSGLSLHDLDQIGDSRLTRALHRLVHEVESGPVAGFQSAL